MLLQRFKNAFIATGVRFWSICDLTHNNIRSPTLLAFTFAFIMAGALAFLVLLLTPPEVPGLQINVIALPGQRQLLGAPLADFSVQLQRANGVAMSNVMLRLDLTPSIPFSVTTRIMNELVPNFDVDCGADIYWRTRPYFCVMSQIPNAQTVSSVMTDQNGLATIRGLALNYGPPGDYELRITTVNADPVLPDVDKSIVVSFFAAVDKMKTVETSVNATTGIITSIVEIVASVNYTVLQKSFAAVIPMRFPRVSGVIPGWLPVASILEDDEPVIDPNQQFFSISNAAPFTANSSKGRVLITTKLIGASGGFFGAALYFGGVAVPLTALVGDQFYPNTVSYPSPVNIPRVFKVAFSTTKPPPKVIVESTAATFQVQVKDSAGNGVPGLVVCFRAVRRFGKDAALTRSTLPKFLPFNRSSPTDASGVATFTSQYLYSLTGEIGDYTLFANVGGVFDQFAMTVETRVGELSNATLSDLAEGPAVDIVSDSIAPSRMQFFVYDKLSLAQTGTVFPVPGKRATLEIVGRRDIRVETSPRVLLSDSQGYFYVDGLRMFVPPRAAPAAAYTIRATLRAVVDGAVVHSVKFNINVPAVRNATKTSKIRSSVPKNNCKPFNLTVEPSECKNKKAGEFCPYNYTLEFYAMSYDRPINDLIAYGPLSDSGMYLEPLIVENVKANKTAYFGHYRLTVKTSLSTVPPYTIFNVFLMSSECQPAKNALNPWLSGRELSFALFPDARKMTTSSITTDVATDSIVVTHKVYGAPLSLESDTIFFTYYPSWFPRANYERSLISSLGLNATCLQTIDTPDRLNSTVVCALPQAAFVYTGLFYFVPSMFGVFYVDAPATWMNRMDIWNAVHANGTLTNNTKTNAIKLLNPENYNQPGVFSDCSFGDSSPVVEVFFAPVNATTNQPLPKGTAFYFKLRRFRASDHKVFTYDMWENAADMAWGALARFVTRSTDISATGSPNEQTGTGSADFYEQDYYSSAGSTSTTTGSSAATAGWGWSDLGVSNADVGTYYSASASAFSSASASFATTTTTTTTAAPAPAAASSSASYTYVPPSGEVSYIAPPVAFVDDYGEVDITLVDLAGFRTESEGDIIEIVIYTADDIELQSYAIQVGHPDNNLGYGPPCKYDSPLSAPISANIEVVPPTIIGPEMPFGFSWKTESDTWRFGLAAYVECFDALTGAKVICQVDTASTKNTWYALDFISKTNILNAQGIYFPMQTPTQRTYYVKVHFPGFDDAFLVGQIYLGLDSCFGSVVTELPSPVEAARSYFTSAQFTCAKLPLKRTLVVATISTGSSSTANACTGDTCGVLSSPRDFAITDSAGTARFQLLVASAPTGYVTISYSPASPEVFTKAAALDAIFAVGVGKSINGNTPGVASLNAYESESKGAVAQLFSSLSTLISQTNRPAVGKPALMQPLGINFNYIRNLHSVADITFEKVATPMLFLKDSIIIQLNISGSNTAEFGLTQRVSIEVWDEQGANRMQTNWVTFSNKVRQWFMTDNAGVGVLPSDALVWGVGGTFTLRFNCRGELSAPTAPFTIVNPNAASIADLQEQAQSMMFLFLLVASPMLLANVPEMPHVVTAIALLMCVIAIGATPAAVDIGTMFRETPLLGFHILVTYVTVWFLALGFVVMLVQALRRNVMPASSRCIDREERAIRAFRYYRWLANARKSTIKTDQEAFDEEIEEETNSLLHRLVRPVRVVLDKCFRGNDAVIFNFNEIIGGWEEFRVLNWEPPAVDPPGYLMPPTAARYVLVMAISITLMFLMGYAGYTMLQFINVFLKVFNAYLSAVAGSSANVFNDTVLSTLKNSVGLVVDRFPEFGFLRSLIPLIENINLGAILNTISIVVEAVSQHALLMGFISLGVAFAATSFSLSRISTIQVETLKQRRELNMDGDLEHAEGYVGIHCIIFAFQALASFVITFLFLILLVIFFRYLPDLWRWWWAQPTLYSIGVIAIITTVAKMYMAFFTHDKFYVSMPLLYGLWIIPSVLQSVIEGVGVLFYRVFAHFFVGFAFSFAIVTRPLIDPLEDPVYVGFISMAGVDAIYSNPTFLAAAGLFLAIVEQKNFYISTRERAEVVRRIIASNVSMEIRPANQQKKQQSCALPPPKRIPNPSDFGQHCFYPHMGHMIRVWISYDMGLLDNLPWFDEARRDPGEEDEEKHADPMLSHESRQGLFAKISRLFFDPAENISMTPEEVMEAMKQNKNNKNSEKDEKTASLLEEEKEYEKKHIQDVISGGCDANVFDPALFPYDRMRWPSFSPQDIRRRKFQRKWYLLLLLHFNPDLQKYRKHNLVHFSGYHYAPEGSIVKAAMEKLYGKQDQDEKSEKNEQKKESQNQLHHNEKEASNMKVQPRQIDFNNNNNNLNGTSYNSTTNTSKIDIPAIAKAEPARVNQFAHLANDENNNNSNNNHGNKKNSYQLDDSDFEMDDWTANKNNQKSNNNNNNSSFLEGMVAGSATANVNLYQNNNSSINGQHHNYSNVPQQPFSPTSHQNSNSGENHRKLPADEETDDEL